MFNDMHPLRRELQSLSDSALLLSAFGYTGPIPHLGELFGFHVETADQPKVCEQDQRRFFACAELMARALASTLRCNHEVFDNPRAVRDFLVLRMGGRCTESFAVLWLDSQHRLIRFEEVFHGTLTQTSVYPRELVRGAMQHNAAAVILAHNHPSGSPQPSRADEALTQTLKAALALVDVRVLDHFIVTSDAAASMAEMGLV